MFVIDKDAIVSIRAPTRGATPHGPSCAARARRFNPRAHEGRDRFAPSWTSVRASVFQSARPRGARRSGFRPTVSASCGFNPRAHEGRDEYHRRGDYHHWPFQSARPRGARQALRDARDVALEVSIRAPTRGATWSVRASKVAVESFNPRAHEGRDGVVLLGQRDATVSIRAPTRGATRISVCPSKSSMFQSARPRGARRRNGLPDEPGGGVSIRAPTRGATYHDYLTNTVTVFQSARPRGARPAPWSHTLFWNRLFQSARPRGARPGRPLVLVPLVPGVSIRAPTRGATTCPSSSSSCCSGFNPRAHEGRDARSSAPHVHANRFQSARPRGARPRQGLRAWPDVVFQSARPRGARRRVP